MLNFEKLGFFVYDIFRILDMLVYGQMLLFSILYFMHYKLVETCSCILNKCVNCDANVDGRDCENTSDCYVSTCNFFIIN